MFSSPAPLIGGVCAVGALLYLGKRYFNGTFYTGHPDLSGSVALITGANTGLGKEHALALVKMGAQVIMACRDVSKGEAAKQDILNKTRGAKGASSAIFVYELDLANFESIRKFAALVKKLHPKINILVNNAGVMGATGKTSDGFEIHFGVNHLGTFLLTNLLLDRLEESAPSRIVVLSSLAHRWSKGFDFDDLNCDKINDWQVRYGRSKLANIWFAKELARRINNPEIFIASCHPGVVMTELGRYLFPGFLSALAYPFLWFTLKTPVAGAQTQIYLSAEPNLPTSGRGQYFAECKMQKLISLGEDVTKQKQLWEVSEKLTKLQKNE